MSFRMILASNSKIRAQLLRNAGLDIIIENARIDEELLKSGLMAKSISPRDIADTLAEAKSLKLSNKVSDTLVLGCDQILDLNGQIISKSKYQEDLITTLKQLSGKTHKLYSAAVISMNGNPIWRAVESAELKMNDVSDEQIQRYVSENWDHVKYCVGGYKLESKGIRLFNKIRGDYFTILGIPLLEILTYLTTRGDISL